MSPTASRGLLISELDDAQSFPLGMLDEAPYEDATVRLAPGDQLVLYTDGFTEAMDQAGQMFGVDRLDQVLGECRDDAADIVGAILQSVERFTDSNRTNMRRTTITPSWSKTVNL